MILLVAVLLVGAVAFVSIRNTNEESFTVFNKQRASVMNRGHIDNLRARDNSDTKGELTKKYDSSKKEILIEDKDYKPIIKMRLTSPYVVSGLVASDDTKVAEFYLEDWKAGKIDLIDAISFYDVNDAYEPIDRDFRFKYEDTTTSCVKENSSKQVCFEESDWIEFNSLNELPHKDIVISLWANTKAVEEIEWIPTINGFEILEWSAWNVSDTTYVQKLDITANETNPAGIFFKPDGLEMYITGFQQDSIIHYNLSEAWNVTSAIPIDIFSVASQTISPESVFFRPNGRGFYVADSTNNAVHHYSLTVAWNISTAGFNETKSTIGDGAVPQGAYFKDDGTKMYTAPFNEGLIHEYALTKAWDVSTASDSSSDYDFSAEFQNPQGIAMSSDGLHLYIADGSPDIIYQYTLGTAWDISTGSFSGNNMSIANQDTSAQDMFLRADGGKLYALGLANDVVIEYDISLADVDPPSVIVNTPLNVSSAITTIEFNATATDSFGVGNCSYTLDGGTNNFTMTNLSTSPDDWTATNTTMAQGSHTADFYCVDVSNQVNNSEGVTFFIDSINPQINITYPDINNSNLNNNTFDINFTRSDANLFGCWYSNDTYVANSTLDTACDNVTSIIWSEGQHNFTIWANDSADNKNYSRISFTIDSIYPDISITAPANNSNLSNANYEVNFTRSDLNLASCWYSNDTYSANTTIASCGNVTSVVWSEGQHNVTVWANDSIGNLNSSKISFRIDLTAPIILDATNITNLINLSTSINSTWQFGVIDPTLQSCFYNTSETSAIRIVTCNSTITGTNWTTSGNKTIYYYANDSVGNEAHKDQSLIVRLYSYIQGVNQTYLTEGKSSYFNLTLNVFDIPATTTATLWYNNISYNATTIQVGANQSNFSRTLPIPAGTGNTTGKNASWFWEYNLTGLIKTNTSIQNQTVYSLGIDNCSAHAVPIVNLSLMDEETDVALNSTFFNTTIEVDVTLTSGAISESYNTIFTNFTHTGASLCVPGGLLDDPTTEYSMDIVIRYLGDSYVEEFYYIDNEPISNTTVPEFIYLRDLLVVDSQSFVVSFSDEDGLLVEDAIIYLLRKYVGDGVFRVVEAGKTDDDGNTILHFVEEDVIYMFNVTKNAVVLWTSEDYRVYCAVAPCSLDLSAIGVVPDFPSDWDRLPTGSYGVSSDQSTRKITLSFNLDESAEMNLTVYEYSQNATIMSTPIGSEILTASSGSIEVSVPLTYGNTTFYSVVYQDDVFVGSHWSPLTESPRDYFGDWVLVLVGLLILTLGLMGISTGAGMIIFAIVGLIFASVLQILEISYAVLIFIIIAGVIIIWKTITRRGD